jgi:hypothetical protein
MAFDFLTGSWQDSVRSICGGVSTIDIPNTILEDDLYATESEDHVKRMIPDWNAIKVTKAMELRRATVYHIAAKVCEYLAKKLKQLESIGDFRLGLQKINWDQEQSKNLERHYAYLELAKEGTVSVLTPIDISSRTPAIYEEFEIIEE